MKASLKGGPMAFIVAFTVVYVAALNAFAKPMEVVLRLREKISMEQLAQSVMDPASDRYHKYFSPEEIRDLAGPSDAEYDALKAELQKNGLTVSRETKTRLLIYVQGDSSLFEKVFATRLENDFTSRSGMVATRQVGPYLVPDHMNIVESVTGFDSTRRSYSHLLMSRHQNESRSNPKDATTPEQVKSAYGIDVIQSSGITGKGQHLAIATFDDLDLTDVQGYYQNIGMTSAPTVDKVLFNGTPTMNVDSAAETETDAELSGMIAPGAAIHVFTSAHNDDAGELEVFTAILDDNRAHVANYSWGSCEANTSAQHKADMDKVFARAVAQGVNITIASGDTGAKGCRDDQIDADFPASNPDVVAVGGTTLALQNGKLAETGWSGSGGGISKFYNLPTWQSKLPAPYVKRSFPDVAFNADPDTGENVWIHYSADTPEWIQIGGTSIAAPQWAGFLTLVNEARGSKGSIGFLNPTLYGLTASQHQTFFDDVTSGNNGYAAGPGWDAVTGWGGMHADVLLNYLKAQ